MWRQLLEVVNRHADLLEKQAAANSVLLFLCWHSTAASRTFLTTNAQECCVTAAAGHLADSEAVFSSLPLYK